MADDIQANTEINPDADAREDMLWLESLERYKAGLPPRLPAPLAVMGADERALVMASRDAYLGEAGEEFDEVFKALGKICESPIERVLLAGMMAAWRSASDMSFTTATHPLIEAGDAVGGESFFVIPQYKIGPYRADFAILDMRHRDGRVRRIVIECDGHDFHERTKRQAARDRSRDRWMVANGIQCLRFTGSEIWADAEGCVSQIGDIVFTGSMG